MNESEKPFFPDIFKEKMRSCDDIEDADMRRDCKITILEDAVQKIGTNQKPVQWWLEVIAEGTKPLFDEIRNEMATKEDLDIKFNALEVRLGKLRGEMASKEDLEQLKTDLLSALEDYIKDTDDKFEKISRKIDNFDARVFKALGINDKKQNKKN